MIQSTYSLYNGYDPDSDKEITQNLVLVSGWYFDHPSGRFVDPDKLVKSSSVGGYNPDTCRFISQNPVMDGVNYYAYCHNNPIKYTDPDGYFVPLVIAGGIYIAPAVVTATTVVAGIITGFVAGEIVLEFSKDRGSYKRDTGLRDLSDQEVSERAHDKSLSAKERQRYITEEKARGLRNKQKRTTEKKKEEKKKEKDEA